MIDMYQMYFIYDELITRIDCQTPECLLVCSFDLLSQLSANDKEVRLPIDQTCLPSMSLQAQRMDNYYGAPDLRQY
jgi:hypothetical protein